MNYLIENQESISFTLCYSQSTDKLEFYITTLLLKPNFKIILTVMQLKLYNSIFLNTCFNKRIIFTKLFNIITFYNNNTTTCSCFRS